MKMRILLILASLLILLVGCQKSDQPKENNGKTNDEQTTEEVPQESDEENKNQIDLSQYFKPDNTTAYFLGDGIEYSTYTEKTVYLSDEYIGTLVDNGGVTMMNVYKISDDQIDIIYKEPVDEEPTFPTLEELQTMEPVEIYLKTPIEVGTKFGEWTIAETGKALETPYKKFDDVFVIEEKSEDYTNRKYFAKGIGEIKTEFINIIDPDKGETYIVTSTLEDIKNNE